MSFKRKSTKDLNIEAAIEAIWAKYDTDGNGELDKQEIK